MGDALDSALDGEELEDETEEEVQRVLQEVAGETLAALPAARAQPTVRCMCECDPLPDRLHSCSEQYACLFCCSPTVCSSIFCLVNLQRAPTTRARHCRQLLRRQWRPSQTRTRSSENGSLQCARPDGQVSRPLVAAGLRLRWRRYSGGVTDVLGNGGRHSIRCTAQSPGLSWWLCCALRQPCFECVACIGDCWLDCEERNVALATHSLTVAAPAYYTPSLLDFRKSKINVLINHAQPRLGHSRPCPVSHARACAHICACCISG